MNEYITKEQLIEFLKENLTVEVQRYEVYTGGIDGPLYVERTAVVIKLCGETISSS